MTTSPDREALRGLLARVASADQCLADLHLQYPELPEPGEYEVDQGFRRAAYGCDVARALLSHAAVNHLPALLDALDAQDAEVVRLTAIITDIGQQAVDWYKKGNGRIGTIEDDTGEKCWIVPDDAMVPVRMLIAARAALGGGA